jgi:hypothetical protein
MVFFPKREAGKRRRIVSPGRGRESAHDSSIPTQGPDFQRWFADLAAGKNVGVFIDDTSFSGAAPPNEFVHTDRVTWVAVVVPPAAMSALMRELPVRLGILQRETGASEFPFGDIYAGRNEFKDVPLERRLQYIEDFVKLFVTYRLRVLFCTLDAVRARQLIHKYDLPPMVAGFDLRDARDLAQFRLLFRVLKHLEDNQPTYQAPAQIYVDTDRASRGRAFAFFPPAYQHLVRQGFVCAGSSERYFPLQLADFAAFVRSRSEWISYKANKSKLDVSLAVLFSKMAKQFDDVELLVMTVADFSTLTLTLLPVLWERRRYIVVIRSRIIAGGRGLRSNLPP